jgi:methylaspartate ammonia-lyase
MKIRNVVTSVGRSGFFNWDMLALKRGAKPNGFLMEGEPISPGFKSIIQPGTALSIMLLLDDDQVAFGDCVDVIFTGAAGRDPLFNATEQSKRFATDVRDRLIGRDIRQFRKIAGEFDGLTILGKKLHTGLRYGMTQALLHAASLANGCTMAEIISREYDSQISRNTIPILASCLDDAPMLDRMILKQAELLPHAAFVDVERDVGRDGGKLLAYAKRVVERVARIGAQGYRPIIHLDVYGTLGELFEGDLDCVAQFLGNIEETVKPHALMVEAPVMMKSREDQIEAFVDLRAAIKRRGLQVQIIADEWCNTLEDIKVFVDAKAADLVQVKMPDLGGINNTIEAVLYARQGGVGTSLGGTGNETDQSTRVTAHIALACQPTFMLSKPGFGGDEALMIETNEMLRTLALINARPN